jgi:photosystem II protein
MNISIEFTKGYKEKTLPVIKLTRSRNGKTGTATFIFIEPLIFHAVYSQSFEVDSVTLVGNNEKIITHDITIFFKEGKPFLLKAIFLFKDSTDWFNFLNFMRQYSKETGLTFSENG